MSSATLATVPDETATKSEQQQQQQQQAVLGTVMGSLRVIELQLVAFIMVFSASGLVPLLDLIFPVLASVYLLTLSRFAFPSYGTTTVSRSQAIFQGSKLFRFYVVLGTITGLVLPLAYVLGGFARGDDLAVGSATPHLFLLSCQIVTENIISGLSLFSLPVRTLVPLLYTVRRIFVIINWIHHVWLIQTLPATAQLKDIAWYWFGRILAVANLVYFSINLFGFLIPRFLPLAFERYFRERDEIHSKMAKDDNSTDESKSEATKDDQFIDKSQAKTDKKSD